MEIFSNRFLIQNKRALKDYSKKWVSDPLHQWSRQYEYPFVYSHVQNYVHQQRTSDIRILDAGSGVTFFPYYLSSLSPSVKVDCCDYDISLQKMFSKVNKVYKYPVNFYPVDLRHLAFPESSYDIVSCISVLEHTVEYETIIRQFKRILKKEGLLIVTFDISIDGLEGMPQKEAAGLLDSLEKYFCCTKDFDSKKALELLSSNKILTTRYIKELDKNLLPWKCSRSRAFKSMLKLHSPKPVLRDLTCFCAALINT